MFHEKILVFCPMFSSILSFPVFSEIERWKQMLSNNCAAPGGGFEGDFQPQPRKLRYPPPSGQGVISGHHHIAQKVFSMVERRIFGWVFFNDAYDVMVKVVYNITFSIHSRCQRSISSFPHFVNMYFSVSNTHTAASPVFDIIILLLLFSNEI